jgi:hypothetical protein
VRAEVLVVGLGEFVLVGEVVIEVEGESWSGLKTIVPTGTENVLVEVSQQEEFGPQQYEMTPCWLMHGNKFVP